jgi:predicted metallo-beta-lactamase superfamily hydrolase
MCTYVETPDVKILLDAGVSLCPRRFNLPPHPKEFKAITEARRKIARIAEKAEVVTVSHYHYDHYTPSHEDWLSNWTAKNETARQIYEGKNVLIKSPKNKINYSQRRRGWFFVKTGGKRAKKVTVADGKTFAFGKSTKIRFTQPVFHGSENTGLGWVLMTSIQYQNEKFMFAPDVQGPMSTQTLQMICVEKPQLLMIGGPPLYLAGFIVSEERIWTALKNLKKIVETVPTIVLEHHILRDREWRRKIASVFITAQNVKCKIFTAASFLKKENEFLEAERKKLFNEYPPSKEFVKWMDNSKKVKRSKKPPVESFT